MEKKAKVWHVAINGYGVPDNILVDFDYLRYFAMILACVWVNTEPNDYVHLWLLGGATDPRRPRMTEAGEMRLLLEFCKHHGDVAMMDQRFVTMRQVDTGLDARDSFIRLAQRLPRDVPLVYFCEWTRQDRARVLQHRYSPQGVTIPIRFDGADMSRRIREVPRTLLTVAALYSQRARLLERSLRLAFLSRETVRRGPMAA